MAVRNVFMKNFPVISVKLAEGNITRSDVVGPDGGIIEDVIARAAALEKGDLVEIDSDNTANGIIVVEAAVVDAEGRAHGILVSDPMGVDDVTDGAGSTAAALAQQRVADVAFFGLGVIELIAGAAITAGASLALSATEAGTVVEKEEGMATTLASNGGMLALTPAADGEKVSVLMNAFHAVAA